MSDDKSFENISSYLGSLAKMKAYEIVNSEIWQGKSNGEKILYLHFMGFANDDIASVIDTTLGTVRKEISNRKNKT